jgi:HlyD family secretion protein
MKRLFPLFLGLGVLFAFLLTIAFLVWKAREKPVSFETTKPFVTDIVDKTVATGAIVPRNEVEIKSRVSGVVDELPVEPGAIVKSGDLIARIRIIPDVQALAGAQSDVQTAKIARDQAQSNLARSESLYGSHAISSTDLEQARTDESLKEAQYQAAQRNLRIIREGNAGGSAGVATDIASTVAGMVLSVDVEKGESVTETNTFNAGTTIATVADMTDMIFKGNVDESEVGKIHEHLPLEITVGALGDRKLSGHLEYISPKGIENDGAIQFEIRAAVDLPKDVFIRAGSSANAAIVLEKAEHVLAVKESVLEFDEGKPYVEVEVGPQRFEKRPVEVGVSDGIQIEVKKGLDATDSVKAGAVGS